MLRWLKNIKEEELSVINCTTSPKCQGSFLNTLLKNEEERVKSVAAIPPQKHDARIRIVDNLRWSFYNPYYEIAEML